MGGEPHDFILNASANELKDLEFVHRTFNAIDLSYFFKALQGIYRSGSSLEANFQKRLVA